MAENKKNDGTPKPFLITQGKGAAFTFDNGLTLSVQWGAENQFADSVGDEKRQLAELLDDYSGREFALLEFTHAGLTAEVAVFRFVDVFEREYLTREFTEKITGRPAPEFQDFNQVYGPVTVDELPDWMVAVKNWEPKEEETSMKIGMTDYAKRHWEGTGGTQIKDTSSAYFVKQINFQLKAGTAVMEEDAFDPKPFLRHIIVRNFTDANQGVLKIEENIPHLCSGYVRRRDDEKRYLDRWITGVTPPRAAYLDVVVYDAAQLEKEAEPVQDGAEYGIVAILGLPTQEQTPPTPTTMMRNELGIEEGGNGTVMDPVAYEKACDYWDVWAVVKQ